MNKNKDDIKLDTMLKNYCSRKTQVAFDVELELADENPITFPPSSIIAASKLSLVLVLGSKNKVANSLCLHFSQ